MAGLKSLAKDTLVYGMSSIVGRFFNYLLVPLHTAVFTAATGGYGVVTNVYAMTALILVLLTFGMETGFFRFANKETENAQRVYANTLFFVGGLSLLFALLCLVFLQPIAGFLGYREHPEYIGMMAVVVALDAFQSIPSAYLRYKNKALKFAGVKLFNIFLNIVLNLFFLLLCPWLHVHMPASVDWFYDPDYLVGYVFVANLLCSVATLFCYVPELRVLRSREARLDCGLLKRMLSYSFPMLILGLVGILNMTIDKQIYPFLFDDREEAMVQLGVYGATSKVALVMAMFTQAFRYAYEPFVFGKNRDADNKVVYAQAMKYFFIFACLAFLTVMFYMDLLRYMVNRSYWDGLMVVPVVMLAEVFKGIYMNLSLWYKLTDETRWGAYLSIIGFVVILSMNVLLVPRFGYMGSAWASVAGYGLITLISYWMGQRKFPVAYDLRNMAVYALLSGVLLGVSMLVPLESAVWRVAFNTILLAVFLTYLFRHDMPLSQLPLVNRFFKKK